MPRTILLADDSVTIRKVVELTFSDTDIRVEAVASGSAALDRLPVLQPDLVLADVAMPGVSGYELCETIKRSSRPVPVLLLASTFERFDAERARACGADGHLVKPFESRVLIDHVETLLDRPPASAPPAVSPASSEVEAALSELAADGPAGEPGAPPPGPVPEELEEAAEEGPLTPAQLDAVARAVIQRLGEGVVREIAWEVVPELATRMIRERLREIEREAEDEVQRSG